MIAHKAFFDPATHTVSYLVWDTATQHAAIIDPVMDFDPCAARLHTASAEVILQTADSLGLTVKWVLETHVHADHLTAADFIRAETGASVGIGARITDVQTGFKPLFQAGDVKQDGSQFDRLFEDGDVFDLGRETVRVMHTPGHTPACVTYLIGDLAFVGDTVFMPDYGTARADFPGGDAAELFRSVNKIFALPDETRIMTGHDYLPDGRTEYVWESTVAEQKARNIHIRKGVNQEDYVEMRTRRDATLRAPQLILQSLQVNIRAGALPPADRDGHHFLTIPLNRI